MYAVAYKAVCYQCSYEGRGDTSLCPVCRFPVIFEPETTPPGGFRLSDILARPTLRDGAPPLPGVDPGKRKAQLLAEARKERMRAISEARFQSDRPQAPARRPLPLQAPAHEDLREALPVHRSWVAIRYAVLCVSAVAAGILAAALQSS